MMRKLFVLTLLLVPALMAVGQQKQTYAFVERDSTLWLDVWRPEVPRSDKACVVALFGGGFVAGERDNEYQQLVAQRLTARGYTVVSPDYRLGLRDTVRVKQYKGLKGLQDMFQWVINIATEDCAAAVAYVVQHAGELNINPERIVLTGSSAGAITVLQLDYCRANALPEASVLPPGWMPAAVVPYSGAVMCKGKPKYATPPAPTMLMHGTKDKIVAYKRYPPLLSHALWGASTVYKRMTKQGFPTWIVRFEGIGHEVASFLPGSVDIFCGFVEQVFDGRRTTLDATMHDEKLVPTEWTNMTVIDLYTK
ncbi:MAG: alpha/beta hydrolase [Bacteroidales bacterium]|nr:alpha/beta hydrolase [Bacteroidales bacterium]